MIALARAGSGMVGVLVETRMRGVRAPLYF
jgi:hypothetical protein